MSHPATVTRVAIAGEFSIFTAAAVRDQLLAALGGAAEVEVDLAQVTELDSAGVQLMLAAKREAAAQDKVLRFTAHSAAVLDTLELCDLSAHCGGPAATGAADTAGATP
ncbi:MAG: STAS domain-containing protein [Rhodocyclaceae bacterium]|nr:STAS domain-containing protein [Rhodocyclaceae bacterium]